MYGIIRQSRQYADMQPCFEIIIYFEEEEMNPFKRNERHILTVHMNNERYLGGVRSTDNAGSWVSPDLYNYYDQNQKIRLSEILLETGFVKNQKVKLDYNHETEELFISFIIS